MALVRWKELNESLDFCADAVGCPVVVTGNFHAEFQATLKVHPPIFVALVTKTDEENGADDQAAEDFYAVRHVSSKTVPSRAE